MSSVPLGTAAFLLFFVGTKMMGMFFLGGAFRPGIMDGEVAGMIRDGICQIQEFVIG